MIILPDDPLFQATLQGFAPPDWEKSGNHKHLIINQHGLPEAVGDRQLIDYLYGGEYEEIEEMGLIEDSDQDDLIIIPDLVCG